MTDKNDDPRVTRMRLARLKEAVRLNDMRAAHARPDGVGEGIHPFAPARGASMRYRPEEVVKTESGNLRTRRMTERGRDALRMADAFDVMQERVDRRAKSQGKEPEILFTGTQIKAGRVFAELVEYVDRGAIKCASWEGGGGAAAVEFMDIYTNARRRRLEMEAAIGRGWAMSPKRAAPHGDLRRGIKKIDLLVGVACGGQTMSQVLKQFGWSPSTKNIKALRQELRLILDDIYGL